MQALVDYFSGPLGRLELAATLLAIINVYLLARQQLINYGFGLAAVLLFGYLFMANQLYSDMLLQWMFYAPLQVVGYFMWKYGDTLGQHDPGRSIDSMRITVLDAPRWALIAVAILLSAGCLGAYMAAYTAASFPYADALTTTMSIAASVLMLRKILENWVIWIAMDLIAIPIYFMKSLYVTSGLYVVFLCLATYGLVAWLRDLRADQGVLAGDVA